MKAALGYAAVAFGAGAAVVGITALLAGLQLRDRFLLRFGRRCVFAVLLAAVVAAGVMEWALLSHDFSIRYVAENNSTSTPVLYTITGLWAALEGSILLWALILGGYLTFVAWKFRRRSTDPLVVVATIGMSCSTMPRPPQCGHGSENASTRPVPMRLRVICTSPSEVTSAT